MIIIISSSSNHSIDSNSIDSNSSNSIDSSSIDSSSNHSSDSSSNHSGDSGDSGNSDRGGEMHCMSMIKDIVDDNNDRSNQQHNQQHNHQEQHQQHNYQQHHHQGHQEQHHHQAATIICLKENSTGTGFSVLLGQNECRNHLKSTKFSTVIMRYPGEYKFPGGCVEDDETLEQAALRELTEEFIGIQANESNSKLHFFNSKTTLPIKQKTYIMNNFIAFADENEWLRDDDLVSTVNNNLCRKRRQFEDSVNDDSFWSMSHDAKCMLSPEVNSIDWFTVDKAIDILEGSQLDPVCYCNDFQMNEFKALGIEARDPMYQTKMTLLDISRLRTKQNILSSLS